MHSRMQFIIIALVVIPWIVTAAAIFDWRSVPPFTGYKPEFLSQPIVKQTCQAAHADLLKVGMPDLGYCSKSLGTL